MASKIPLPDLSFDIIETGVNNSIKVVPTVDRTKEKIQLPLKTVSNKLLIEFTSLIINGIYHRI